MIELGFDIQAIWGRPLAHVLDASSSPAISPSAAWNGFPASGFSVLPSDPVRTTAKPAVRLLEPPHQRYTETVTIGVAAFALDGTTLVGGIDRVRFHYEGNTLDVIQPSFRMLTREDGSTYPCLGYWTQLRKPEGVTGEALLFVEAVPADATMQNRVIGPYSFYPQDLLHDWQSTVGASGADYTSIRAALNAARSAAAQNPLIELIDDGDYVLSSTAPLAYTVPNWTTIRAAAGAKPRLTRNLGQEGEWRPRHRRIWIEGVEFDLSRINRFRGETDSEIVVNRCRFVRPGGRALWFKTTTGVSQFIDNNPWQLECYYYGAYELGNASSLIRGGIAEEVYGDFADRVRCAVHNSCNDLRDADLGGTRDALTIAYKGSGTATVSGTDSGTGTSEVRAFEFYVDDNLVGSFAAWASWTRHDDGDDLYEIEDLVNYINTLPGWSATLLDNNLIAAHATDPANFGGFSANDFPTPIEVGEGLTLIASLGLHQDGFVHPTGANENVIIYGNRITTAEGQLAFLGGDKDNDAKDLFYVKNLFEQVSGSGLISNLDEFSSDASHVVFAHNTWSRQMVDLQMDTVGGYCVFSNNVADMIRGDASNALAASNNHVQTDGIGSPAMGLTNTVQAGTRATLYSDPDNLDFSPAGQLLENPKMPIIAFGIAGSLRQAAVPVGAVHQSVDLAAK